MEVVPNQPIKFTEYYDNDPVNREDCLCPEIPAQLVNWGDVTQFQLTFDACDDATNILVPGINSFWEDWTLGSGWSESYDLSQICHTGSSAGTAEINTVLTIGNYYKITFTVSGLTGSGCYAYGLVSIGYEFPIEANGTYTWFGEAVSTDFGFYAPADVDICIEDTAAIYEITLIYNVFVSDAYTGSTVATITDLTVVENTITVSVDWVSLGLSAGCYYILVEDETCTEPLIYSFVSNDFKVGDWPCTVLINACSESNNNGFVFEDSGFVPKIRLDAALVPASPEITREKYTDSTGKRITYFGNKRKFKKLRVGFEPEYVHDFLSLLGQFDHVYVDGVEYFVEDDDYQLIEDDNLPCLPQATITLSKKTEKVESNLCAEPSGEGCAVTCVGEYEESEYDNDEYFTC